MTDEQTPSYENGLPTRPITYDNFFETYVKYGPNNYVRIEDHFRVLALPLLIEIDDSDPEMFIKLRQDLIDQYIACYKDGNYMRDEITTVCESIESHNDDVRVCVWQSGKHVPVFHEKWKKELSDRIDSCILYRSELSVCIGNMLGAPEIMCKAILFARAHNCIFGEFSCDMNPALVPHGMVMYEKRKFAIPDCGGGYLDAAIISPALSDTYWNDTHLGLCISLSRPTALIKRAVYPLGTMYILLPNSAALRRDKLVYEMACVSLSLQKSEVPVSDEMIHKMTEFMKRLNI